MRRHLPESQATVAIPARLCSSRLARKVLLDISGKTMLHRTHDAALEAACGPVVVLTDAEEVADEVRSFGGEVMMTDPSLESGTARIASVVDRLEGDVVINLQGDAPLMSPSVVSESAAQAAASGALVTMPVSPMVHVEEIHDPSVVKVARAHDGRALYCSRSPVPHVRDVDHEVWAETASFWGHPGLYAYSREFLHLFGTLAPSPLEGAERLEQLRWLEAGLHVHTFEVEPQGPSVDTLVQLERVREMFAARENR
jgi:3-deoxy-D-manno-octulosonate cytidylyltransferase